MIDVIASWWRPVRPNCRNAVIVRMRSGDLGVEPAFGRTTPRSPTRTKCSGVSWQERPLLPTFVCSNCGQDCQNTPYSATRDCTLEFNASVSIVHLPINLQIACHSFFDSERPLLTGIRYLSQFAQALASFGAGEILPGGECRRHDRRAPQGAPGTRPGSVW